MITPSSAFGRWALGSLLVVGLGIGACEMPTESQVSFGKQVTMTVPGDGHALYSYEDMNSLTKHVVHEIESMPGVESININLRGTDDGRTTVELLVGGTDVPEEEIRRKLEAALGDQPHVQTEIGDLTTTVKESWGNKLRREFLHLESSAHLSDEELRAEILRQLAEAGQPNATVEVTSDGDIRTINVENVEEVDGGLHETQDEMQIELKEN